MPGFNYDRFKEALRKAQEDSYALVLKDIQIVKAWIEKALTLFLESSTNMARTNYPGLEI